jgi:hypothetical protein
LSGPPAERETSLAQIRQGSIRRRDRGWLGLRRPGSGKSRILRWLEAEAILRGWNVVSVFGACAIGSGIYAMQREKGPTLIVLDEVHAAGAETLELLEHVAREGDAPPLQVVAAVRVDAIEHPTLRRLIDATGTVPTLRRVDLGRLDAEGVRAMACRATGDSSPTSVSPGCTKRATDRRRWRSRSWSRACGNAVAVSGPQWVETPIPGPASS